MTEQRCQEMKIQVLHLIKGARIAEGLVVVIDVLRACSTLCYLFARNVRRVWIAKNPGEAFELSRHLGNCVLVGERSGRKIAAFDLGNSPTEVEMSSDLLCERDVVFCTSAGSRVILESHRADEVVTASFVNALAVADYINRKRPALVSLVCCGRAGRFRALEDELAAAHVERLVFGERTRFDNLIQEVRRAPSAEKFFDPTAWWAPESDLDLCLRDSVFDFVVQRVVTKHATILRKIMRAA